MLSRLTDKRFWPWLAAVGLLLLFAALGALRRPPAPDYTVVPNWPQLPADLQLGQVAGVAVDSQGRLFAFARNEKVWATETIDPGLIAGPAIYILDGASGQLLGSWGENLFVMPHGLTIDAADNVWLTDVGLHQVFKYDAQGHLLMVLGEAGVPGEDETHFNRPTDVAIGPDGSIFVSDGYENSHIVHFDAAGQYLSAWGSAGAGPGEFAVPHSIAVDPAGRLYVADRGNARLQIFSGAGVHLASWEGRRWLGRPWAVRVAGEQIYVVDGGDQNRWWPDRARILLLSADGDLLGQFGAYGNKPGQFIWPHAIAVGPDGALYVAEVGSGQRLQKFVLENHDEK